MLQKYKIAKIFIKKNIIPDMHKIHSLIELYFIERSSFFDSQLLQK